MGTYLTSCDLLSLTTMFAVLTPCPHGVPSWPGLQEVGRLEELLVHLNGIQPLKMGI